MIRIFPEEWGPKYWNVMEITALHYPVDPTFEQQEYYRSFFYSLGFILPCEECSEHYIEYIKEKDLRFQNRFELITSIIELHNNVNTINKKPQFSLQQFMEKYDMVLQDLFT